MTHIKRAIILVHYDKDDIVDAYIYAYLNALRASTEHLVFVSTAKLDKTQIKKLHTYCDKVIVRENRGYDFMSYKIGLESFDYREYDEVLICNDSVYGPLYPIEELFTSMHSKKCDFWGITENTDMGYHIQSYFILFKKSILQSKVFTDFWKNVKILYSKDEIIQHYEVGLSQILIKSGFTPAVSTYFQPTWMQKTTIFLRKFTPQKILKKLHSILSGKAKIIRLGKINTAHYFWKELLLSGDVPFIKIELLRDNPMQVNIEDFEHTIQQVSSYDISLIHKHLQRMREEK